MSFVLGHSSRRTNSYITNRFSPWRRLTAEALEPRLALTSTALLADVVPADGSLPAYLAQAHDMGPVAAPAPSVQPIATGDAALDAAAVDSVFALGQPQEAAPAGENMFNQSPNLIFFDFSRGNGYIVLTGHMTDEDPLNSHVRINGVQFANQHVGVDSGGRFTLVAPDQGWDGYVTAVAYDYYGYTSNTLGVYLY